MIFSEALGKVAEMLKSYPPSELDHSGYIGALASCLTQYPRCIAIKCGDPLKGVVAGTKFKPTIADLTAWCERELAGLRTIVDRDDQEARWAKERAELADRERARIAHARDLADVARVKAKLAETLESLNAALGRKTAAAMRAEAEQALARYAIEARSVSTLSVSDELAKIMRGVSAA
jgi:hypothetical protein